MKKLLLVFMATVCHPVQAENAYPHFEIFEYNFEDALYRAEAENNLLFCTFEPHKADFHNMDCFEAIKYAIEVDLSYKTIMLKLILKNTRYPNQDPSLLNKKVNAAIKKIDPQAPIDTVARQIIQSALSIGQK